MVANCEPLQEPWQIRNHLQSPRHRSAKVLHNWQVCWLITPTVKGSVQRDAAGRPSRRHADGPQRGGVAVVLCQNATQVDILLRTFIYECHTQLRLYASR